MSCSGQLKITCCPKAIPTAGERLESIVREAITCTTNPHLPSTLPSAQNNQQIDHFDSGIWRSYQSASIPTLQRITPVKPQVPLGGPTYSQFTSSSPYYSGHQPNKSELLLHQNCCDLHMPMSYRTPPGPAEQERSSLLGRLWNCPALPQDYRANAQMLQDCLLPSANCPLLAYGRAKTNIDLQCDQANTMISQELERKSRAIVDQQLQLQLHSCQILHHQLETYNKLRTKPEEGCSAPEQVQCPDLREENHDFFSQRQQARVEVRMQFTQTIGAYYQSHFTR